MFDEIVICSCRSDNGVAVMVTLPMRNGNQKKFCLSAGFNQKRATNDALDLIIKHSTVIKVLKQTNVFVVQCECHCDLQRQRFDRGNICVVRFSLYMKSDHKII